MWKPLQNTIDAIAEKIAHNRDRKLFEDNEDLQAQLACINKLWLDERNERRQLEHQVTMLENCIQTQNAMMEDLRQNVGDKSFTETVSFFHDVDASILKLQRDMNDG